MKLLESFIKNVIVEDLDSFLRDTKGIYYSELTDDEAVKSGGKDIKRIWAQNVDRNFIQSLTKIHWIRTPNVARLQNILQKDGKDEISAMAYLPGAKIRTTWSNVGVLLDGYVTLAANNMDYIYTGFSHGKSRDQKQAGSGIAKRPGMFEPRLAKGYILDKSSFNPATQGHNEILLDNWKVKGLILPVYGSTMKSSKVDKALFAELAQLVSNSGLKLYDMSLNELSLENVVKMTSF